MTHFISSFFIYLFIYKGTSGLAYNVAVLNGPIKKKNRYQGNQYLESRALKIDRDPRIFYKDWIDWIA